MKHSSNRSFGIAAVALALALGGSGCALFKRAMGSGSGTITLGQMPSNISTLAVFKVGGDPLAKDKVEYPISGKGNYDRFFRDAAMSRASLVVSTGGVDSLTINLKNIARTRFAMNELSNDNKDIPEEAIAKMAMKKDQLSADQKMFIIEAIKDVATIVEFMNAAVSKSQALVGEGTTLTGRVSKDFVGPDAVKVPAVTRGLQGAMSNVKGLATEAPVFLKRAARLTAALNALK